MAQSGFLNLDQGQEASNQCDLNKFRQSLPTVTRQLLRELENTVGRIVTQSTRSENLYQRAESLKARLTARYPHDDLTSEQSGILSEIIDSISSQLEHGTISRRQ